MAQRDGAERRIDEALVAVHRHFERPGHAVDVEDDSLACGLDQVDASEACGDEALTGESVLDVLLAAEAVVGLALR